MRRDQQRLVLVALALSALACGGRSSLEAARGGEGGATLTLSTTTTVASTVSTTTASASTSSSSSSSSSGAGGAPSACAKLELTGPPITFDGTTLDDGYPEHPRLVRAGSDASRANLVFWSSASPKAPITHLTFSPWGTWPANMGQGFTACTFGGGSIALAPAAGPGFSMLFYPATGGFPPEVALAPWVSPETTYSPCVDYLSVPASKSFSPLGVARGAAEHVAVYEGLSGPYATLALSILGDDLVAHTYPEIACAQQGLTAAVAPAQSGYLVAAASGRSFGACMLDDGIPGLATELQIMRLDMPSEALSLTASLEDPDRIVSVALAKAPSGAWVLWRNDGASAFAPPPVQVARIDEGGAPTGPVFSATPAGVDVGPFAAAAIGDLLAIAWSEAPDSATIHVRVLGPWGEVVSAASLPVAPSFPGEPTLSLLASPSGDAFIVAWSDVSLGMAMPWIARFSCILGE